ncbi:hypothetical protein [Longimicrobium sp.]|uniref:hypothetical protein n=1 Tax=Longimicrobium sp. TaxID=2029185 RepID=UPI002E31EC9F|nr:hypothetical protein [Longimicrobium sp.]HEX6039476.1 hypothetical protein [Longimicrobium sp.]
MKVRALVGGLIAAAFAAMPVRAQAVDLGTPEAALRTYWRTQDALDSIAAFIVTGPAERDPFSAVRRDYERTLGGRAAEVLASPFIRQTYTREVEAVDMAGPARALIMVIIHNTTPLPQGTPLTHEQEELRNEGQQFRYVLDLDGATWRITQIQQWDDLGSGWQDLFVDGMTLPVFARW